MYSRQPNTFLPAGAEENVDQILETMAKMLPDQSVENAKYFYMRITDAGAAGTVSPGC